MKGLVYLALLVGACKPGSTGEPPQPPASPQATAEPAPLASLPVTTTSATPPLTGSLDRGSAPQPLRADREVGSDGLLQVLKESTAYTMQAVLRAADVPVPAKSPEVSQSGLDAARKKTEPRLLIDANATHMRMVLGSGFVLPAGSELRSRVDRYGSILLAPEGVTYRVVEPGALRALLGERRLDVAPLSPAEVTANGEGPKRLGKLTRKAEVATRAAKASFDIAHLADLGDGGTLVCRALLDLMNAPPSTPLCGDGDAPLHAELRWTTHGAITFDVVSLARRTDLAPASFATPPPTAAFAEGPLPDGGSELMLTRAELAGLRVVADPALPPASGGPAGLAPGVGGGAGEAETTLTLANSTDELRFAWLDGVPIAWLAPGARAGVRGLQRGHYILQWRTFLGDAIEPPQSITLPFASDLGATDAAAAPQ